MASLSVRKLDEETLARLRARAASHGISMEEEARRILKEAVTAPERLGDLALRAVDVRHVGGRDQQHHAQGNDRGNSNGRCDAFSGASH